MKAFFRAMGGRELALEPGETMIRSGPANLFRGIEAVGGFLWLTDRRLVFRSHGISFWPGESAWPLRGIARVETATTMWVFRNAIRCSMRDGRVAKMVVEDREGWARDIESARARGSP